MRTGVFGGTFNPVHLGHLIIAQEVLERLSLDEVRFVPAAQPWMKQGQAISDPAHRLKMLELSLAGNPRFVVDRTDLERGGTTYTVDTLRDVKARLGAAVEIYFILGADALQGFSRWKEPGEIIRLANLVVVPRPGYPDIPADRLEAAATGISSRLISLKDPCIGISGVDIRKRVAEGRSVRYLVSPGVAEYIAAHRLYVP
ncbi:MAG: nicotinate-nucleotide adenylyltransferase [Chloroflexi bacterium]|nr:nicotinate-nucleotide adenylyltransferase [Chloroflexota bacterium]